VINWERGNFVIAVTGAEQQRVYGYIRGPWGLDFRRATKWQRRGWYLTHRPTQRSVGCAYTRKCDAVALADRLDLVMDWGRVRSPRSRILAKHRAQILEIVREVRG